MTNGEELEFLDGRFVVPDHLAVLMGGMDTTKYRYQRAVELVNEGMLQQHLGGIQSRTINRHFEKERDDGRR
jgi:hypothetical protein